MSERKSVLFVALHRPERSPSQRFRFEQYTGFLDRNGFDCEQLFLLNASTDKAFYSSGKYFSKLRIVLSSVKKLWSASRKKYDIVFVQREAFMLGSTIFERRFSRHSKLIFDFDDSIWLQNVSEANKKLVFLKNPSKTSSLIGIADLVFAGNPYLADYARQFNPNVAVVPTTVDTDEYKRDSKAPGEKICIGWSGSPTTIQHFSYAVPVLKRLQEKYGDKIEIRVIGDGSYRNEELGITGIPWTRATEVPEVSKLDIGIMPLPDNEWSRGKCGLKGLVYMSLGIPAVMSPVGVNSDIVTDGENGMLAGNTEEWAEKLSLLIEDSELRKKLGEAGRETVEAHYSVNAWKEKYLALFKSLV